MTIKAHPGANPGKQHQHIKIIASNYKNHSQSSTFEAVCEGCGWSAQFHNGKEAGEAGWAHHKTAHHNKHTEKSLNTCDGAATRIFCQFVHNRSAQAAKLKGGAHQIASAVEPEGRDKK